MKSKLLFGLIAMAIGINVVSIPSQALAESPLLNDGYRVNAPMNNNDLTEYYEKYKKLRGVLIHLKREGIISDSDISKIYKHYEELKKDTTKALPDNDKELLENLYENKIITGVQYQRIIGMIDEF